MSFDEVFIHNDVDTCYNLFISKITSAFDNCFKAVRLSRSKAKDKAWITPGIKNSIRTKNNLYKKWKSSGKDSDETLFKKYRREYEKIAYKAEQKFYHDKFNSKCKNIKQLWSNLNNLFSFSKPKNNSPISKLTINNTDYTNTKDICNELNSYYCSIGPKLASSISCKPDDFFKYCDQPLSNSLFCTPVSASEILNIVSHFRDNKSPGYDNIGPKLLKPIIHYIIDPFVHICNLSFSTGIVPDSLKIAKVIAVYKKGEKMYLLITDLYHYSAFLTRY